MYLEASPSLLNFINGAKSLSSSWPWGRDRVKPEIRFGFPSDDSGDPEFDERLEPASGDIPEDEVAFFWNEEDGDVDVGRPESGESLLRSNLDRSLDSFMVFHDKKYRRYTKVKQLWPKIEQTVVIK